MLMPSVFYLRNRKNRSARAAAMSSEVTNTQLKPTRKSAKKRRARRQKLRSISMSADLDVCLDPIMLEPISSAPYVHERPGRAPVLFNVETLVAYMLHSGTFADPVTRIPFTDEELASIDAFALQKGLVLRSVLAAKNNKEELDSMKFRRDAILGLERCAGAFINATLSLLEGATDLEFEEYLYYSEDDDDDAGGDANDANAGRNASGSGNQSANDVAAYNLGQVSEVQSKFFAKILPEFSDLYRQLRAADSDYARQCMHQWEAFLRGPPNRPTKDRFKLTEDFLRHLKSC